MPFGAARPAIGASLLKAELEEIGVSSRIAYLNMRFAQLLGSRDYEEIAERMPTQSLAGDWVFSPSLFGERPTADAAWSSAFAERFTKYLGPDAALVTLNRARVAAEGFLDDCLVNTDWEAYDVVGFTSTFFQHAASLALAQRVKLQHPHVLIGFGGGNCEAEMGLQLHRSFPFVDFVCSGEADISFPKFMQDLREGGDGDGIPGVIIRRDGHTHYTDLLPERVRDLDELPYPNYDDYFEQRAEIWPDGKHSAGVLMETSRGCWWGEKHHCTFCGLNGTAMAFRSKSADRVLAEIAALSERYEPSFIAMVDNILDMRYFHDLLPTLRERGLNLELFYETKANLTKEHLRTLKAAGVTTIQPGIESLSTNILKIMRKGTTAVQNVQLLKWCKELEIKAYWNLIYGFPGEDPLDYDATADMIESIQHLQPPVSLGSIRLDRFSPNYVSAEQLGILNIRADRSYGYVYALPEEELRELAYYFEHDYVDGRDPDSYVGKAQRSVRRWHEESQRRGLLFADHGEVLGIWDFRAGARQTVTILSGAERALYIYCDQHRSRQKIDQFLAALPVAHVDVDELLYRLVESRLMLHLDDRYLSLAIPASSAKLDRQRTLAPSLAKQTVF
jgi:ribosomal peptide maturation radical SAM protein 1